MEQSYKKQIYISTSFHDYICGDKNEQHYISPEVKPT